ncbi:MAG: DUF368 domain-containing protein, partial [Bacteroidetes bacterium]
RNVLEYRIESKGVEVPFVGENVLPAAYEGDDLVIGVVIAFVLGLAAVYFLARFEKSE